MMIKIMFCLFFIKTQVVGTHLNTSYGLSLKQKLLAIV